MIQSWKGTIALLAPLSHNSDENMGTDTKFRRIKIQAGQGDMLVPVYSGNAFRGKLRRLACLDFFTRIGIDASGPERISDRLYYTFFSGGALQKGSTSNGIDVGLKRELRSKVPILSLLGTAFVNQILPGKLDVGIGIPIASETEELTGIASEASVWSLVEEVFYTRRDDLEDKEKATRSDDTAQQMKYTIECLSSGTELAHEFTVRHATEIELSCFGAMLLKFEESASLGGKGSVGHGKVRLAYEPDWPDSQPYCDYLETNRDEIRAYVREMERKMSGKAKEAA